MNIKSVMNIRGTKVTSPDVGDICLVGHEGELYPCVILSGCYFDPVYNRLSNFWHWRNLITGKEESGYGNFYKVY